MDALIEFFQKLYDPEQLMEVIRWGGYAMLNAIVFIETGLLIGFFLPGDSLLVTAGVVWHVQGWNPLLHTILAFWKAYSKGFTGPGISRVCAV